MDIIELLPAEWRPTAYSILAAIVSISVIVAGLKPIIVKYVGEPSAGDPNWKRAIYVALRVLDALALNSNTIKSRKELNRTKAALNSIVSVPGGDQ